MKLLYIINKIDGRGGLNRIAFDKINYLIDYFDIEIIYYGNKNSHPFYYADPRIKFHSININALSSYNKKILLAWKAFKTYRKLLKYIKPDIIINMNVNLLSWLIPFTGHGIPKIIELHQSYDGVKIFNNNTYGKNSWKGKFAFLLRNIFYPKYDKVVVLTQKDIDKWGYKNMMVIPNFTNIKPPKSIDETGHNFLWCGRLSNQKGFDYLTTIWTAFTQKTKDWKLFLIGKLANENIELQKQLNNFLNSHKDSIIYLPETTQIENYYQKSSIYLSTSRYEGLPLCLVEAATMGKPIIGFDIVGNDEVVDNGTTGILVPPYDTRKFVEAMSSLSSNLELRCKYSQAAFEKSKIFDKEKIMNLWIDLFNTINQEHNKQ